MSGSHLWDDGFIAVDWGTTNRRAYLIDRHCACTEDFEDSKGILNVGKGGFDSAVAGVRERLGDRPMLLAGMIGSNRGWIEAPYVACPAGFLELARNVVWADDRRTAIVPGLSLANGHFDVMRGEEVQLVGAVAHAEIPGDCIVCHPGTHNKWVEMDYGKVKSFRTVLTGELFNLLKERSILSDLVGGKAEPGDAFLDGVRRGLSGAGVTAELFGARARSLLGKLDREDGASFISGLLIGEDVRVGLETFSPSKVYVMGRPDLTRLYASAIGEAGVEASETDGEQAFISGAAKIVDHIE